MAESIVVYLVDKLSSLVAQEAGLVGGVAGHVVSLRDEMNWIQCLVRDADKKRRISPLVDVWMTELTDLAYDAEDVIDAYILHLERIQCTTPNWFCCRTLTKIISTPTLHRLGLKIEQINARARLISARKSDYDLQLSDPSHVISTEQNLVYRRRGATTVEEEFYVVGFRQESAQVASWLMDEARQARQVVSIVGMGGLGKTTLAQKVYKNVAFHHFSFRIWITVSQQYQVRDLLLSALKQINPSDSSLWEKIDTDDLKEKLYTLMDNRRYLVVMDDIWMVEAWEKISGAFPNNHNGSRVLFTTRNKEVALRAASSNCLDLRLLDRDESWELFCKKVFSASGGDCPLELVQLGKAIVDKCSGLPLAILVIGGLLMGKGRIPNAWSRVLDSVTWHLSQDSNECHQILILSYIDLPYHLKLCFLYFGLFPENYDIPGNLLIRLWVAEGFVQGRGDEIMENVAEDHLEELIQRSLIQVTKRLYYGGRVSKCRVHDLLRDVAISEGRKDKLLDIHPNNNVLFTRPPRRLAIHPHSNNGGGQEGKISSSATNLKFPRSLMSFDKSFRIGMYLKSTFGDGKSVLRVLDLGDAQIGKKMSNEIGRLVSLHYLRLCNRGTEKLPNCIGNLLKLETLDVQGTRIKSLPLGILKLKNLRHLLLSLECYKFKGIHGCASIEDFARGLLTLNAHVYFLNFLVGERCLQTLQIRGKLVVTNDRLRSNSFPLSLNELYLDETYIEQDPSDVLGCLPNLKVLRLNHSSYIGSEMVFSSGRFLQLQYLCFLLEDLQEWRVGNGAIPNLVDLWIYSDRLNGLPDGLRDVRTLQRIDLTLHHLKERLKENGEEWNKIKHIPFKHIS